MYCSKNEQPVFRVEKLDMPLGRMCDTSRVRLNVSCGFAWSGSVV